MSIADRLKERGLVLPAVLAPGGNYLPAVRAGDLLFLAGQVAVRDGELVAKGRVGAEVSPEVATTAAEVAVLNALGAARDALGDLERVEQVARMTVYVASAPDFANQSQVANGASDLLVYLFGDRGRHARSAVGMASLPMGSPVEVELTLQVKREE
jgi:enamine deaminase RidA (YjgF/YER057c/UK114 family)